MTRFENDWIAASLAESAPLIAEMYRDGNPHRLTVFHNPSALMPRPERAAALAWGKPLYVEPLAPGWFHAATPGTPYELELFRRAMSADQTP